MILIVLFLNYFNDATSFHNCAKEVRERIQDKSLPEVSQETFLDALEQNGLVDVKSYACPPANIFIHGICSLEPVIKADPTVDTPKINTNSTNNINLSNMTNQLLSNSNGEQQLNISNNTNSNVASANNTNIRSTLGIIGTTAIIGGGAIIAKKLYDKYKPQQVNPSVNFVPINDEQKQEEEHKGHHVIELQGRG